MLVCGGVPGSVAAETNPFTRSASSAPDRLLWSIQLTNSTGYAEKITRFFVGTKGWPTTNRVEGLSLQLNNPAGFYRVRVDLP
jgi:hypothetical protein